MIDIATIRFREIKDSEALGLRTKQMFLKLFSLTGLDFAEHEAGLLAHLVEFKSTWTLLNVYKAFEFNHSEYCTKQVEYYGSKECTVPILSKVLNNFKLSENLKPKTTVAKDEEITKEERISRNMDATRSTFSQYKANRTHPPLSIHWDTLIDHFGLDSSLEGFKQAAETELKERKKREKAIAQLEMDMPKVRRIGTQLENLHLETKSLGNIQMELAIKSFFNQIESL